MSRTATILVVDDHDYVRTSLTRLLQRAGHSVVACSNGVLALEATRRQMFDLILLDMLMPEMSGDVVLETIKADPSLRHIPVIIVSADQDLNLVARCIELGAADYLSKPFIPTILHARVNACLEQKRLRDAEQEYVRIRLEFLSDAAEHPSVENDALLAAMRPEPSDAAPIDQTLRIMFDRLEAEQRKRRQTEEELRALNLSLEARVAERTAVAEQQAEALRRSEEALRRQTTILLSILDSMGDAVVVTDAEGQLLHHNPAAIDILGDRLASMLPIAADAPVALLPDQQAILTPRDLPLAQALLGKSVDSAEVLFAAAADHAEQWLSITARPLRDIGGRLSGSVAVIRDVTAAKHAEAALRASEERYALAAQGANDGLWDWDLTTGKIFYAPRWKAMLGYTDEEIATTPEEWFGRLHPDDREHVELHLTAHTRRLISSFELEYRILHHDFSYRWMLCRGMALWNDKGAAIRMVGSQTDITDRKHAEEQLAYGTIHDALTGLPNRALFMDRLSLAFKRMQREEYLFAVLFLDLDRFKTINDSLGHTTGDALLVAFAQRLESALRPGDTIARLGGDEFTVLLDQISNPLDAEHVAERIKSLLQTPLTAGAHDIYTSASIGLALSNSNYERPEEMLRDADTAMYQAKLRGRAHHAIFNSTMHAKALSQFQLETDLRGALDRHELRVHYQPIIDLTNSYIAGFEALVRWQHPQHGLVPPSDFVPLAEDIGMIDVLGQWVLAEACQQLRKWQTRYPSGANLWVNVNLSARQLEQPTLVTSVAHTIAATGLEPHFVKLEITESALIAHGELAIGQLNQLKALGVGVCIDDFGTGYSSLSYLSQFPADTLKIDRSFVKRMGATRENTEIVKAIITLAHSLNMTTVAEGTETEEQAEQLRRLECEYGQGWLFYRALPADQVETLLQGLGG